MDVRHRGSKIFFSLMVTMGLGALSLPSFADKSQFQAQLQAKPTKVAICHLNKKNGTYRLIMVNPKAVAHLLARGDILPPAGATDCSGIQPPAPTPAPTPKPPVAGGMQKK